MTHYSNDYFDRETDAIGARTAFSGGSGVLTSEELRPAVALISASVCGIIGISGSVAFYINGNGVAAELGALIAILAWSYSSPPLRLSASGLGELDTALIVGSLVPLLGFAAQTTAWNWRVPLWSLPTGLAMFAMMICVQVPDYVADSATGKRNLLVRFGVNSAPGFVTGAGIGCILTVFAAIDDAAPRRFFWLLPIGVLIAATGILGGRLNPSPAQIAFAGAVLLVLAQIVSLSIFLG